MEEKSLEHVGVMGIHWGHRKAESSGSSGGSNGNPPPSPYGRVAAKNTAARLNAMAPLKRGSPVPPAILTKGEKKAQQEIIKAAKVQEQIRIRKDYAKREIEYEVEIAKKSRNRNYNEAAHRAQLEKIFHDDLNATPESIHKENVKAGKDLAFAAALIVGGVVLHNVLLAKAMTSY